MLATYVDAVLRDPDAELERLDQLLQAFTYVTEKDVFRQHCVARLAKRLLTTTPNGELEADFVKRLKLAQGQPFTHTIEVMLADRAATAQQSAAFAADASSKGLPSEFRAQVLTAGQWPSSYRPDALVRTSRASWRGSTRSSTRR